MSTRPDLARMLKDIPALAVLSPETRQKLAETMESCRYEEGELLFEAGASCRHLHVIGEGIVQVLLPGDETNPHLLHPGDAIGLRALFGDAPHDYTLKARKKVLAWRLSCDSFRDLLRKAPDDGWRLLQHLGQELKPRTGAMRQIHSELAPEHFRVALFDTKPYTETVFREHTPKNLELQFHEARLSPHTAALAAGCQVIVPFVNDQVNHDVIERLADNGTGLIAMRCAGYNNVDLASARQAGITVARVPAYSPYAVAEHAMALILTQNRRTHRAYNRVREGNFSLNGLVGFDLHGRTVGIIGLGKIGKVFAQILTGFGMRLLGYDKYQDEAFAKRVGLTYVALDELLRESDIISLHAPLLDSTYHMIDAEAIAAMKRGVMLINTSRGALIDAPALIEGLKSGQVGYAGLDVYEEEEAYFFEDRSGDVVTDDVLARLMTFPNVLITSHQAFLTDEALRNIAQTTFANIAEFREGKRFDELTNAVLPQGA